MVKYCPFSPRFLVQGAPTKIDYRKRGSTLILTSLLEDLVGVNRDGHLPGSQGP